MTTDIATIEQAATAQELTSQVQRIQQVMQAVMKNGVHYGTIPGCGDKPALLKPGAEKLMMTFRLAVDPEVVNLSDEKVTRYRVLARITSQTTGLFLGQGVGECSSDEEKYAWRKASCEQEWNEADPEARRMKWTGQGKYQIKQIRTNPADVANTVLKMAKKRALVDATLTVTAASDIFSQDLDDLDEGQMDVGGKQVDPNEEKLAQAKAARPSVPPSPTPTTKPDVPPAPSPADLLCGDDEAWSAWSQEKANSDETGPHFQDVKRSMKLGRDVRVSLLPLARRREFLKAFQGG
jgi:hypothetical protein